MWIETKLSNYRSLVDVASRSTCVFIKMKVQVRPASSLSAPDFKFQHKRLKKHNKT